MFFYYFTIILVLTQQRYLLNTILTNYFLGTLRANNERIKDKKPLLAERRT